MKRTTAQDCYSPAAAHVPGARLPPAVLSELFDVTACYFPISFTPPPNDPHGITRPVLIDALRGVFTASPALAPHVVPLLLEKLGSSITSAKRDAAQTLAAAEAAKGGMAEKIMRGARRQMELGAIVRVDDRWQLSDQGFMIADAVAVAFLEVIE
jgi:hypothetical protein